MNLPQVSEDTIRLVTLDASSADARVCEFTREQPALHHFTVWVMQNYGEDTASTALAGMAIAYTALKLELSKQQ